MSLEQYRSALKKAVDHEGGLEALATASDPQAALARLEARFKLVNLAGAYTAAERGRKTGKGWSFLPGGHSANAETLDDIPSLRQQSRELSRNNPIANGVLSNKLTHAIGTGLTLQSQLDADLLSLSEEQASQIKDQIESYWRLWSNSPHCDFEGVSTFAELQGLAFRAAFTDGDVFALFPFVDADGWPFGLRVQLIEADRVANPPGKLENEMLGGGVERDKTGKVVAYHIADKHPGALNAPYQMTFKRVDASTQGQLNVLHLFHKLRAGQNRGVPELAPVIEALQQLGDYTEAELQAAVVSGLFAVAITSQSPVQFGAEQLALGTTGSAGQATIETGQVINLKPGEDIKSISQNRPNQAFDGFVRAVLVQVGMGLGLPYEVLLQHFSSSYSASRAALLQAWKHYKARRHWLASRFCQPIFELWLDEAVARGLITAPGYLSGNPLIKAAYAQARWVGPAPGQINAKEETEAALLRINANLSTFETEAAELSGGDYYSIFAQRSRERVELAELGLVEMLLPGQGPAAVVKEDATP